jgi:short-subunit dehydrogenase
MLSKSLSKTNMRIIIIGATSGIGLALAKEYAEGNEVIITGRSAEKLLEIKADFPQFETFDFDVKSNVEIEKFFTNLSQPIDLIINCAGWGELNAEFKWQIDEETLQINAFGFAKISHTALQLFKKQGFGHLAVITSVGGLLPSDIGNAYNATKSFQIKYTQGLQSLFKKTNISITEIRAGMVDTKMLKGEGSFWVSKPEKAAKQIKIALSKKKKLAYITKRWAIIGFISKHFLS